MFANHADYAAAMDALHVEIQKKHKMLVLIDLGGTLFFRTDQKDCGRRCDYKFKRY